MSNLAPSTPAPAALKNDYADLVKLLAELTDASNDLSSLESDANREHLAMAKGYLDRYQTLQTRVGEAKAAVEVIAARNPQWFADKKTLATPFGEVKRTTSTSLVIADEAVTITLIKAAGRADDFLKVETSVCLEVLEKLDDAELAKFGARREVEHNFKPEGASVDFGKAVAAAKKDAKAAKKTVASVAASAA